MVHRKILFLVCLTALLSSFSSCEKNMKIKLYVARDKGVDLKTAPSLDAPVLSIIPFNEAVLLMDYSTNSDMIGDIASSWAKVQYQDRKGWVFAAYLTDQRVNPFRNNVLKYVDTIPGALGITSDNTTRLLADLEKRFGKPLKASSNLVENKYDTNYQDTMINLSYTGLDLKIYAVSYDKRQLIESILLKSPAYPLLYGLVPGTAASKVTNTLGSPEEETENAFVYRIEGSTLAFILTNQAVREIHLVYYID